MVSIAGKACPRRPVPRWHRGFLILLPRIYHCARFAFRHLDAEAKQEAIQSVITGAMAAYVRLVELGKADIAYAAPLAHFAIRQYRDGRMLGRSLNCKDIASKYCQRAKDIVVERLDHFDPEENTWCEVLVEDRHAGPADIARTRIDFSDWLDTLKRRDRRIALKLAEGEKTSDVAKRFKVSEGRVSQLRRELAASWRRFVGDEPAPVAA